MNVRSQLTAGAEHDVIWHGNGHSLHMETKVWCSVVVEALAQIVILHCTHTHNYILLLADHRAVALVRNEQ